MNTEATPLFFCTGSYFSKELNQMSRKSESLSQAYSGRRTRGLRRDGGAEPG